MEMKAVTKVKISGLAPKTHLRLTQIPGAPPLGNDTVVSCGVDLAMALITAYPGNVAYAETIAGHPKVAEAESDVPFVVSGQPESPVATEKVAKPSKIGRSSNKNMAADKLETKAE